MSFALPMSWPLGWPLTITKCATNPTGGTDVEASFCGTELAPFSFADYDVSRDGFDELRLRIESVVGDQIADALRLAS